MPILQTIADQTPELMIFLGDNIYGDTEDMDVLQAKYDKLGADAGFQRLTKSCPTLATWDDHDFGVNMAEQTIRNEMSPKRYLKIFGWARKKHEPESVRGSTTCVSSAP